MEKLWYDKGATFWRQALPIGNGHTGVMIFGGKKRETLAFNDCTLWSGYPKDQTNENSLKNLEKVRELIFEGKNSEADELTMKSLSGAYCESFMPLGNLLLDFKGLPSKNYRRELDLSTAVHTVSSDGVKREAFASYPDDVVVYKIASNKPFSVTISTKTKMNSQTIVDGNGLNLVGNAPDYVAPNYLRTECHPIVYSDNLGMSFCLRTEVDTDGFVSYGSKSISISNARIVTLFMATATGFIGYDKMPETNIFVPLEKCKARLQNTDKNYDKIKQKHISDYKNIYDKQRISLNDESNISTYNLIKYAKKGVVQTALVELFYNFGKYLIISGSRKGSQALNLQGLWNAQMRPPWSSNYTANINAEMNYWSVTKSNLSDCIEPYIELVSDIIEAGKKTAKVNYGCEGSACNHNVDIWRKTAPVQGSPAYMYAPLCGVWLANEVYTHYKNGRLEQYKDKIFTILRESAKFANDYLVLHNGEYVTCPSASPEADFLHNGKSCRLDYASNFEMGLVKQCFNNYVEIANDELSEEIKEKIPKLYPFKKGRTGLLEWHDDFQITEKGHRHFSPLYSFYPGNVINYYENPEETKWVEELFEYRTNNSKQYIGWSAAWAISISAKLHNSQKALKVIESMLSHAVFYNLFAVHPPFLFQIDGNLGFVAGINEMLVYEENGIIELLPATPEKWKKGSVKGMVVGGAVIDFTFQNGKVTSVSSNKKIKLMNKNISENCNISKNIKLN